MFRLGNLLFCIIYIVKPTRFSITSEIMFTQATIIHFVLPNTLKGKYGDNRITVWAQFRHKPF